MAYELHLTRDDDWTVEVAADPITATDVVAACLQAGFSLGGDGQEYFSLQRVKAGQGLEELMSARLWRGQVTIKPAPPDQDAADRLTRFAEALGARMQGDEGETYEVAPVLAPRAPAAARRRFWQRR